MSVDAEKSHKGFYEEHVLPRVIHFVCGLDIGIGSGRNLPYYNSDKIEHLWGLDPSPEMWALAKKARETVDFNVEFMKSGAENIPLDDHRAIQS